MFIVIVYLLLIGILTYFYFKKGGDNFIFTPKTKVGWLASAASLFMIHVSADQGQLFMGIVKEYGVKGMWMLWSAYLGAFIVPIVFAPIWYKLQFSHDNAFYLLRFPGNGGRLLYKFRAYYVGVLVVSLSLGFHIIGFSRIVSFYFQKDSTTSILVVGLVILIYSLKNTIDLKIRTDNFHMLIYVGAILFTGWSLIALDLPTPSSIPSVDLSLFPEDTDTIGWFGMITFLGFQWWSATLFDGGGPEMARYTAVKSSSSAIKSGILSVIFSALFALIMLWVVIKLCTVSNIQGEESFIKILFSLLPHWGHDLVVLGFFAVFISTVEALMNWGGSFVAMDLYPKQLETSKFYRGRIGFLSMLALSFLGTVIALYVGSLRGVIQIVFSVSAGVAPVYILRWFWYRISAWSQISAMVSSGVFTLLYPLLHELTPLSSFPMEWSRVIVVTILTSVVWVSITLLNHENQDEIRSRMLPITGNLSSVIRRFAMALVLGVSVLLVILVIYTYSFEV